MVSINTIKGAKIIGVLWGIRWINKLDVLLIEPYIIIANHIGRANPIVMLICLVAVKM